MSFLVIGKCTDVCIDKQPRQPCLPGEPLIVGDNRNFIKIVRMLAAKKYNFFPRHIHRVVDHGTQIKQQVYRGGGDLSFCSACSSNCLKSARVNSPITAILSRELVCSMVIILSFCRIILVRAYHTTGIMKPLTLGTSQNPYFAIISFADCLLTPLVIPAKAGIQSNPASGSPPSRGRQHFRGAHLISLTPALCSASHRTRTPAGCRSRCY